MVDIAKILTEHWEKVYTAMKSSPFGWGEIPATRRADESTASLAESIANCNKEYKMNQPSEWISVEDRLPELKEGQNFYRCFVYCETYHGDFVQNVAHFVWAVHTYGPDKNYPIGCFMNNGNKLKVTHWRPLFDIPKEKQE